MPSLWEQHLLRSRRTTNTRNGRIAKRRPRKPKLPDLTESELEAKFLNLCLSYHLPKVTQQHPFHPQRQWRLDFSWPDQKLAVEIQGFGPGHNSYTGMLSDYEKHNQAVLLGWRFLYFMGTDLVPPNTGQTINIVRLALGITTATAHSANDSLNTPKSYLDKIEASRRKLNQIFDKKQGD